MDMLKTIFGIAGGVLIGLYFTGHDVVSAIGLPFDKQLFAGGIVFLLSMIFHVLGGGDV